MSALLSILALAFSLAPAGEHHKGRCSGDGTCTACTSCKSCRHCAKEGGTCGACAGGAPKTPKRSSDFTSKTVFKVETGQGYPITFSGEVVGISDGDTITVLYSSFGKSSVKIRLHGIDAPESRQAFGQVARQFTSKEVFRKTVTVHQKDTDKYGRLVAEITYDRGKNLNHELVRAGLAWWYQQYARGDRKLQQLEAEARAKKVGLWRDPNPTAPWEFRRMR